ncbi:hypothetical protein [Nitratireductor rhodophyticola]|uniref:hypothetical protein n=1 Tax=Nitratireductor rhodophyticola TaxID=2854036 RepID=UPI003BACAE86
MPGIARVGVIPGYIQVILSALVFVVLVGLTSGSGLPTVPDEIGYLAIGKWIGGSGLLTMGTAAQYYFGQGILLSPLFAVMDDHAAIYQFAVWMSCFWTAAGIPLLYWIGRELGFKGQAYLVLAVVAMLAPSYFYSNFLAWTETIFRFSFLASVYVALRAGRENRAAWWLAVALLAVWLYALHPRALGILLVAALIPLAAPEGRKWTVLTLPTVAVGFMLVREINAHFMDLIWARDVSASALDMIRKILTVEGLKRAIIAAFGQVWYQSAASLVLVPVGALLLVRLLFTDNRNRLGLIYTALAAGAVLGASVAQMAWFQRVDHVVYGRYVDGVTPVFAFLGLAAIWRGSRYLMPGVIVIAVSAVLFVSRPGIGANVSGLVDPNVPALLWMKYLGFPMDLSVIVAGGTAVAFFAAILMLRLSALAALVCIAGLWAVIDYTVYQRAVGNEEGRAHYLELSTPVFSKSPDSTLFVHASLAHDGHFLIDQYAAYGRLIAVRNLVEEPLVPGEGGIVPADFHGAFEEIGVFPNGSRLVTAKSSQ